MSGGLWASHRVLVGNTTRYMSRNRIFSYSSTYGLELLVDMTGKICSTCGSLKLTLAIKTFKEFRSWSMMIDIDRAHTGIEEDETQLRRLERG